MALRIGVVGATGMVGRTFLQILNERRVSLAELRPFASADSDGKSVSCRGRDWKIRSLGPGCFDGLDLVFFSSGDDVSREWAPQAVKAGAFAIDNSAAFRRDERIPLIVPEVNGDQLKRGMSPTIIANPNCSTIQLVVALKPLIGFGLRDVRVSSYQAVSGAGQAGQEELLAQLSDSSAPAKTFPHSIAFNVIPQIGSFVDDGFCAEEDKIMFESVRILGLPDLKVSAFTVRVPAMNSHSEAVWVELDREVSPEEFLKALRVGAGLHIDEDPRGTYATAKDVSGEDPVYVSRLHRDRANPKVWMMWVVSDNLRKGAALNGFQIAERIFDIPVEP